MMAWIEAGGAVMWVLLAGGLVALLVFIERALHLHRARIRADDFLGGIRNVIARNNLNEALTICDETAGPVAYIVGHAIRHRTAGREVLRERIEEASRNEISRMERRLVVLVTTAQLAPLLGLLGTVLGLVKMVVTIQAQGALVQTVAITGHLMEALVTTAAGLCVAIPCYAAFNLLVIKIDRIVLDMNHAANEITAMLTEMQAGTLRPAEAPRT